MATNRRILVIDDNREIHEDFRKILSTGEESAGSAALDALTADILGDEASQAHDETFQLDFASQGQEGLEMVRRALDDGEPYAVTFVDVRMPPGWDGVETIENLWQIDSNLQSVIITAFADYDWSDIVQRLGNTDRLLILKKPFENIEIRQIASALCEKWNLASEMADAVVELKASKARYADLYDNSPDMYVSIYPDTGLVRLCNQTLVDKLGYSKEEIEGRPIFELYHPDCLDDAKKALKLFAETGMVDNVELQLLCKDGRKLDVNLNATSVRDEQGEILYSRSCWIDISARKQAERNLQVSEQRLVDAQQVAHTGSWELDLLNDQLVWSEEAYHIFEVTPEDGLNSHDSFIRAIHPDDQESVRKVFNSSLRDQTIYDIDYRLLMDDGRIKFVREQCEHVYDEDGQPLKSIGTIRDVTERKQLEESLRRSQKMEAIGQLTGGIAHDFNNILAIILGNLDLLERQADFDPQSHKRIEAISKAGNRAAKLTKQLLGFSRIQSVTMALVDINKVLEDMENLISRSVTPEVEVVYQQAENLWQTKIDLGDFEDAVLNLVLNARDAMQGHGHLRIETRNTLLEDAYCQQNPDVIPGDYVEMLVKDNGIGITPQQKEHIFEPFFTTKEQGKGTGLGLAMVFGFIRRSGGHISCDSEVGVGTTFKIYLPRSRRDIEKAVSSTHQSEALPHGSETILVVDDEPALVELAADSLQEQGYRVISARNGKQALELLDEESKIDLLFSDVVMPGGINGYELAEQVVQHNPGIKLLLCSGYSEGIDAQNRQQSTDLKVLSKPYSHDSLIKTVREVLDGKSGQ